ncbi:MAG: alpha/beta hydrolase [Chloroflexi bacterium]|nr:alpha/beta hydrolase [Chloroflexota bacterium]
MKRLIRLVTVFLAWLGLLANSKIPDGRFQFLLMPFKFTAGPLSPFLALFSGLGALGGLRRHDWLATLAGAAGLFFAVRHIQKVTDPHDEFEHAFGPDWAQRIPHHMQWKLYSKRYELRPLSSPPADFAQDYVIGRHYETGKPLLADIWQPAADNPRTGIGLVYLHGSGWHYLDKDFKESTRPLFQHLTNQGHLVVDVAYTLAPEATLIPMVADVKRAIAWMKTNADQLQINPERIVLMGASAGGHLALLAAYTPCHPILDPADVVGVDTAVYGVISNYGLSDLVTGHEGMARIPQTPPLLASYLEKLYKHGGMIPENGRYVEAADMIPNILGGLPDEEPEMYQLASPITHVGTHCPATLLLNGTHDFGLDVEQHRQLHAALYRHNVPCVHVEFNSADHAYDMVAPRWSPAAQAALYDIERFLALLI